MAKRQRAEGRGQRARHAFAIYFCALRSALRATERPRNRATGGVGGCAVAQSRVERSCAVAQLRSCAAGEPLALRATERPSNRATGGVGGCAVAQSRGYAANARYTFRATERPRNRATEERHV